MVRTGLILPAIVAYRTSMPEVSKRVTKVRPPVRGVTESGETVAHRGASPITAPNSIETTTAHISPGRAEIQNAIAAA